MVREKEIMSKYRVIYSKISQKYILQNQSKGYWVYFSDHSSKEKAIKAGQFLIQTPKVLWEGNT